MLRPMLVLLIVAATAAALRQGESSRPARAHSEEAVLEGVIGCSSDQPMVVYVETAGKARFEPSPEPAAMDQRGLEFVPHVLPVLVGTRVAFINSDPVGHNVFSASPTKPFNLGTYPEGVSRYVTFDRPGVVEILCNVHPEMGAYILVLETPYFTLTNERGQYRITGLPTGSHSVSVWCEVHGKRGRQVRLAPGVTRLDFEKVK